jgi:CHASE3 domain sensor protein
VKKRLPRERSLEVDPREVRRRLWVVFAILGLLIGALAVTAVGIAREIHNSARTSYLRQAFPLRAATRDLALQLVNEETGVRGYVITGNRSSLAPYSSGLRAAVADAHLLMARAEHVRQLAVLVPPVMRLRAQLNAFFAKEIKLAEAGSRSRERAAAQVESGKEVFDRFRFAIASVQALATIRVEQATARQDSLFTRLALIVGGAGLLAVVLVGLLAWRLPQRIFILLRSEQRAREKAERLQRETEAVQGLTVDLSASLTAEQIHAAIVKAARDLLGADSTTFVLVDEHDGEGAVKRSPHAAGHESQAAIRDGQPRYLETLDPTRTLLLRRDPPSRGTTGETARLHRLLLRLTARIPPK